MPDRRPIGKDQVDPWLVLLWEEHATIDDQDLAAVFQGGHVATDLTKSTESDETQAAIFQFRWRTKVRMWMVHMFLERNSTGAQILAKGRDLLRSGVDEWKAHLATRKSQK